MPSRKKKPGRKGSKTLLSWFDMFGPRSPDPTKCPDCGSGAILRICYGLPGPGMAEKGRRGEIVLGGCIVQTPRWYCKNCLHRWPEDPPPEGLTGIPEWQEKHIAEKIAEFAALTAEAAEKPPPDEPVVENYWERRDGRRVFVVRFPWGKMRLEKRFHLVPLGGTPVYDVIMGMPPFGAGYDRSHHLAQLAAVRFERRPPA
jgi:hypothetical protein